jgi:hypothetical protein
MRTLKAYLLRLRNFFRKGALDRELTAELTAHLELNIADNLRSGMSPEEARRNALLKLGGVEQTKESIRDRRGIPFLETFLQDVRFSLRILRKNPGFTAAAVLTTALGIAANVSVFSFVDALFLRNVPARNQERLVRIVAPENDGEGLFSLPEYIYLRDHTKTLEELAAHYSSAPLYISANGTTGEVQAAVVSSNYFPMLGLRRTWVGFLDPRKTVCRTVTRWLCLGTDCGSVFTVAIQEFLARHYSLTNTASGLSVSCRQASMVSKLGACRMRFGFPR